MLATISISHGAPFVQSFKADTAGLQSSDTIMRQAHPALAAHAPFARLETLQQSAVTYLYF